MEDFLNPVDWTLAYIGLPFASRILNLGSMIESKGFKNLCRKKEKTIILIY